MEELTPRIGVGMCIGKSMPSSATVAYINLIKNCPAIVAHVITTSSILPEARNKTIGLLLKQSKDLTHILLIDDDMSEYFPEQLASMVERDVDIIGPVAVQKEEPYKVCCFLFEDEKDFYKQFTKKSSERKIIEVSAVGLSFTLIKIEVFNALREQRLDEPEKSIWFHFDRMQRSTILEEAEEKIKELREHDRDSEFFNQCALDLVQLGISAHIGSPIIGEDFSFCWRARVLGFKIFVDPVVCINHIGEKKFSIKDSLAWTCFAKQKMENIGIGPPKPEDMNLLSSLVQDVQEPQLSQRCSVS